MDLDGTGAEAERALLRERIVDLRICGLSPVEIAKKLTAEGHSISWNHVQRIIRDAAQESATRLADTVDQRRMEQDKRVELLLSMCMRDIDAARTADPVPMKTIETLLRAAVSLFERQARLLGLDANKNQGQGSRMDWLNDAPFETVVAEAEKYGLVRPGEFKTPAVY